MRTLSIFAALVAIVICGVVRASPPDVEFEESRHGAGTELVCKRAGEVIYRQIGKPTPKSSASLWTFYWQGKAAATVLTVGDVSSVRQSAELPVSFAITFSHGGRIDVVSVERPDGTVVDGLLRQADGRLTPVPTSELPPREHSLP
jgi:hypothetical protein